MEHYKTYQVLRRLKSERKYEIGDEMMNISEIEGLIRPIDEANSGDEPGQRFQDLKTSFQQRAKSLCEVEGTLRTFYGSKGLKVAHYRRQQGSRAGLDRAIRGMLNTVHSVSERMVATKRSVTCQTPECGGQRSQEYNVLHNLDPAKGLERDRDHNAGQNMANAAIQWLTEFKWPVALQRTAKQ
ncbi:hypothetical protein FBU30_000806 [Linnemannia zychae]|nr:hypothetical protein FBU30_000806 [Linnemannia zychae]